MYEKKKIIIEIGVELGETEASDEDGIGRGGIDASGVLARATLPRFVCSATTGCVLYICICVCVHVLYRTEERNGSRARYFDLRDDNKALLF